MTLQQPLLGFTALCRAYVSWHTSSKLRGHGIVIALGLSVRLRDVAQLPATHRRQRWCPASASLRGPEGSWFPSAEERGRNDWKSRAQRRIVPSRHHFTAPPTPPYLRVGPPLRPRHSALPTRPPARQSGGQCTNSSLSRRRLRQGGVLHYGRPLPGWTQRQ